ncbi:hypothetical protein ABH15_00485 [Methanoculleus taiwanensis]|uniref:DUF2769 domain-containing protein n=1 Tax=Methanoculleus taiwanensis TaxID=1550565 RepID=A0A498H473_9EURY|nr:DUF2769 domain-containing protein [Methanoculleus taiwanensis]RXE56696.1 hypothetical protein ABH15_00485 [Methanoculleus taiwanensis]
MDRFEEKMKEFKQIPPEKLTEIITQEKELCTCPDCPAYTECAENAAERLFCAIGGSFRCITEQKTCLCPTCPISREYGLTHTAFCVRSAETNQRYFDPL